MASFSDCSMARATAPRREASITSRPDLNGRPERFWRGSGSLRWPKGARHPRGPTARPDRHVPAETLAKSSAERVGARGPVSQRPQAPWVAPAWAAAVSWSMCPLRLGTWGRRHARRGKPGLASRASDSNGRLPATKLRKVFFRAVVPGCIQRPQRDETFRHPCQSGEKETADPKAAPLQELDSLLWKSMGSRRRGLKGNGEINQPVRDVSPTH